MSASESESTYFFFNDAATTEIYTLSLHERSSDLSTLCAIGSTWASTGCASTRPPTSSSARAPTARTCPRPTRSRSEEHTSELQSRQYLVCRLLLEKKTHRVPSLFPLSLSPPSL